MRFILASSSPRRRELLEAVGADFTVEPPDAPERVCGSAELTAEGNAAAKASSVAVRFPDAVVIGADTVVAVGNSLLGKPETRTEASRMLSVLSGTAHRVVTGVAVASPSRSLAATETTVVRFRMLSQPEIDMYLDTGEWEGKAGAYAVQDEGGGFVEEMDGSYSNVIGLPMELLARMLPGFGVDTGSWISPKWRGAGLRNESK